MKLIIKYDPEEADQMPAVMRVVKSLDMALALYSISQIWRRWKHSDNEPTAEEVFEAIREVMMDQKIDIDELIQ